MANALDEYMLRSVFVVIWGRCSLSLEFQQAFGGPTSSWAAERCQSLLSSSHGPTAASTTQGMSGLYSNILIPSSGLTRIYMEGNAFRMFWIFGSRHYSSSLVCRDQRDLLITDEQGWNHQPLAVTFVRDLIVTQDSDLPGGGEENHLENTLNKTKPNILGTRKQRRRKVMFP